jgi:hypothetical protein
MRTLSTTDLQELSIPEQELLFNYCASRGGSRAASNKALYLAISGLLVMVFDYYFSTSKPFNGIFTSWVSEAQSIIITVSEFLIPVLVLAYLWIANIRNREEKTLQLKVIESGLDISKLTEEELFIHLWLPVMRRVAQNSSKE